MGTLYISTDGAYVSKTDERLVVKVNRETLASVPLLKVEGVVVLGRATISPFALTELLERNIPLTFLKSTGRYLGRLEPDLNKNIYLRKAQWSASENSELVVTLVRDFVRGKLKNYKISLLRARREGAQDLDTAIKSLEKCIASSSQGFDIDYLRGLEGAGSAAYFSVFNLLIKSPDFEFKKRTRRPPTDPVNALLSFGYSLLNHDIHGAINIVGFDPYLGYLHQLRYGRASLALDLMEEFRPLVVDSVVLTAINRKVINAADFIVEPVSGMVSLAEEPRKEFLRLYEQKKQSKFTHPVLGTKCSYREAFEIQARFLAKFLLEEIDLYPPLVMK